MEADRLSSGKGAAPAPPAPASAPDAEVAPVILGPYRSREITSLRDWTPGAGSILIFVVQTLCRRLNMLVPVETQLRKKRWNQMAEGTIKRLTDKGFGFIDVGGGKDLFFHMSALEEDTFEDLQEGQRVSFTEGQGPKGPRAENVRLI